MGAAEAAGAAGNVGRIMGFLMKDHKGDVDGKLAQKLLKYVVIQKSANGVDLEKNSATILLEFFITVAPRK